MNFDDLGALFFIVFIIIVIIFAFISERAHTKWLKENYPPLIDLSDTKGIANISVYEEHGKYNEKTGYKEYTFIRKPNGSWRYVNKKKATVVLLCVIPVLIMSVCWLSQLGIGYARDMLIFAFFWSLLVLGLTRLESLEARMILKKYLQGKLTADADGKLRDSVPIDPEEKKRREETAQKNEKQKYEILLPLIRGCVKTVVFLMWFAVFCFFLTAFGVLVYELRSLILGKESFPLLYVMVAAGMLMVVIFIRFWMGLRKPMMGDHSLLIPLNRAGRSEKYAPETVLKKLADDHVNVILAKGKNTILRIYGQGEKHIVEIRMESKDSLYTWHMTETDSGEVTTVMPVTDENAQIIMNKWEEWFPVRNSWLVGEELISRFLRKLYEYKDIHYAMKGFSFTDTSEETKKLISGDADIIPSIPVQSEHLMLLSGLGAEWLKRKLERAERAMEILGNDHSE
ncbi:MAG: hypothetical protein IKQ27_12600 [Lachnospiraceae bacterium]|nr:hypothetical protein [Lachnospiraceae bacterium]